MSELLLATILSPLIGVVSIMLFSGRSVTLPRILALLSTLVTVVLSTSLVVSYLRQVADGGEFATFDQAWMPAGAYLDLRFRVSLDGLSLWLFELSAVLMVTCVLVSWEAIKDRAALFYGMLLLLQTGCLGVFAARDIILFYVFFEFTLIPLFFLIGIWGSEQRRYAAIKFFLFTLAGSVLTFLGLLTVVFWCGGQGTSSRLTFSIPELTSILQQSPMSPRMQLWVFLALFAGFAIKVPLFPLHTWLPLAHVQAPTAGSVVLAGILLKIGTYGFARFSIPMLPDATATCMPWILWLSVAGIIYGALVALAQTDIKRLIAYSSVSHLGFCMLGLFALNRLGAGGGTLQMINHGISTGALFALVGMIYERFHTRQIDELRGLARPLPIMAFFMLLFTFSSIGLPGLNGFAGEVLLLLGMFHRGWAAAPTSYGLQYRVISVLALTGVVLGAWYMLWLVRRTFFGPTISGGGVGSDEGHEHGPLVDAHARETIQDLKVREILALAPLAILAVWIGVWPQLFLQPIDPCLERLSSSAQQVVNHQVEGTDEFVQRAGPGPSGSWKIAEVRPTPPMAFIGHGHSEFPPSVDATQVTSHAN